MGDLMEWLCEPKRIPYYIGIRISRAVLAPFVYMTGAILVKWLVIGKFKPGPRDLTNQWTLMRHWLAATLFSRENMQAVTDLLGRHYDPVSHCQPYPNQAYCKDGTGKVSSNSHGNRIAIFLAIKIQKAWHAAV